MVTHLSSTGSVDWTWTQSSPFPPIVYAVRPGGVTSSNCCALIFREGSFPFADMIRLDRNGTSTGLGQYPLRFRSIDSTNALPVIDDQANPLQIGRCFSPSAPSCAAQWIRSCGLATDLWQKEITSDAEWLLTRDPIGTVYASGTNGMLARYSNTGDLVWSNNFARPTVTMLADSSGNRFVSFADGAVARLADENVSDPSFAAAAGTQGAVQLSLFSQPQQVWQVQWSTNLVNWSVLGNVTNGSGGLRFSDPTVAQTRAKFYRAVPQ
jgi:hypothetical protein